MANRIFQGLVLQMKESIDRAVGVIDAEGNVVANASDSVESYAARMSTGDDLYMAIAKFAQAAYNSFHA